MRALAFVLCLAFIGCGELPPAPVTCPVIPMPAMPLLHSASFAHGVLIDAIPDEQIRAEARLLRGDILVIDAYAQNLEARVQRHNTLFAPPAALAAANP